MFDAFGEFNYSFADILLSLTPFWRIESDSFVSAYLMWWLFIPFLNVLVNGVNRKKHMLLISLCIFCFSVLPLLPFAKIDINPICWFSTIYFVASYIRFYPQNIISNIKCLAIVTCFMMLLAVLGTMLTFYASNDNTTLNPYWLVMDYNAPLALFISVSSFLLFKNIKMKHSKLINTIGATTFGILLIHAHSDTMRKWLWEDIINTSIHYLQFWYAIVVCILIFIMCSAIDYTRIKLIENPLFRYIDKFLENNKWTNKI